MDDDLLVGRYRRVRALGAGGMGEVWLAEDLELGRSVAVKRLRFATPEGSEAELVERMRREARVVARLHHPAIVTLHDLVRVEGRPYLIMQFVDGESLADRCAREGTVSWTSVAPVVRDIAGALDAAHRAGVLHRDVKPANVLLDVEGGGHLADFGIARAADDAALTRAGEIIGTVAYLPPEIARDQPASAASDVWSLGATFFAAVEGRAPFADSGASVPAILARLAHDDAPAPQRAGACHDLLVRMLATDPEARPTAAQVAAELARVLATPPPPFAPETRQTTYAAAEATTREPLPDATSPMPRRRRGRLLAAAALMLLVAAGVGTTLALRGDDVPPPAATSQAPDLGPAETVEAGFTTVDVGGQPTRLEMTLDGATSYVANQGDDTVTRIDNATGATDTIDVGPQPKGVTVAPDGAFLYVPRVGNEVSVVDTATDEVVAIQVPGEPGPLRLSEDGATLYVPTAQGTIEIVDTAEQTITASLSVGGAPGLVHLSPDGATGYSPDPETGTVAVIDTVMATFETIEIGGRPDGLQVSVDGTRVYVTEAGGTLPVIDTATDEVVERIDLQGTSTGRIRLQPGSDLAWVPNPGAEVLRVFDVAAGDLTRTVEVGARTGNIVLFDVDGDTAYVPDLDAGDVAVIDTESYEVTHLTVGDSPRNLTLSADGAFLYAVGGPDGASPGTVTVVPLT